MKLSTLLRRADTRTQPGLTLPGTKVGLPENGSPEVIINPDDVILPLVNYQKQSIDPVITVGQTVRQGELLAPGVIASIPGTITEISTRPIIHASAMAVSCIHIKKDKNVKENQALPLYPPLEQFDLERIEQCGVKGLGGAGFPSQEKFRRTGKDNNPVRTLIVNAVECEPVISCDEYLIRQKPAEAIRACVQLSSLLKLDTCLFAIENDKQDAIKACSAVLEQFGNNHSVKLYTLEPVYPSGAERILVQRVSGIQLAPDEYPRDKGVACLNIATVMAIVRALQGFPLTSRIVTVAGSLANKPMNVRVPFGTTIKTLLEQTGNLPLDTAYRLRVGGPLSGFDVDSLDLPIEATTNCIMLEKTRSHQSTPQPCIRCNACSDVCPMDLLPQQLYWLSSEKRLDKIQNNRLSSCIECGCCDVVCPSNIPLTAQFRHTKGKIKQQEVEALEATIAKRRYDKREKRLILRRKQEEQQRKAAIAPKDLTTDPIKDALARARKRRQVKKTVATKHGEKHNKPSTGLQTDD